MAKMKAETPDSMFTDWAMSPLGSGSPMRPPEDKGKAPENSGRQALPGLELVAGEDRGRRTTLPYRPTLGSQRKSGGDQVDDLPLFSGAGLE